MSFQPSVRLVSHVKRFIAAFLLAYTPAASRNASNSSHLA
jgi:hypothetical protein